MEDLKSNSSLFTTSCSTPSSNWAHSLKATLNNLTLKQSNRHRTYVEPVVLLPHATWSPRINHQQPLLHLLLCQRDPLSSWMFCTRQDLLCCSFWTHFHWQEVQGFLAVSTGSLGQSILEQHLSSQEYFRNVNLLGKDQIRATDAMPHSLQPIESPAAGAAPPAPPLTPWVGTATCYPSSSSAGLSRGRRRC